MGNREHRIQDLSLFAVLFSYSSCQQKHERSARVGKRWRNLPTVARRPGPNRTRFDLSFDKGFGISVEAGLRTLRMKGALHICVDPKTDSSY